MNYVSPPSMYRPRKEMKARNNKHNTNATEHNHKFYEQFKTKKIQSTANVPNDGHKIPGKKNFQRTIPKKNFSPKMEKNYQNS